MATKSPTRDEIRSATLGESRRPETKLFDYNGVQVEFRQPTIKERKAVYNKASTEQKDGTMRADPFDFMIWSVIYNTYVPGGSERVFDEADFDSLVANPAGSFVDRFGEEIAALTNVNVADRVKNSVETANDGA